MANLLKVYTTEKASEEKVLRKTSREVTLEELKSPKLQSFLDDLVFTAQEAETEEGYIAAGLAAIQVGKDIRVFCFLTEEDRKFEIMANPKIEILKPIQIIEKEGCLSIPKIEGNVARFIKIRVSYLDREGKRIKRNFSGYEAREIQHEYDHLEGILFTDKLID